MLSGPCAEVAAPVAREVSIFKDAAVHGVQEVPHLHIHAFRGEDWMMVIKCFDDFFRIDRIAVIERHKIVFLGLQWL